MDDRTDNLFRAIVATQHAQGFILDYLLKHVFLELPKQARLNLADALLEGSVQSDWLNGLAKDEFQAEWLADVVVRVQGHVDQAIGRALLATEEVEGSKWKPI